MAQKLGQLHTLFTTLLLRAPRGALSSVLFSHFKAVSLTQILVCQCHTFLGIQKTLHNYVPSEQMINEQQLLCANVGNFI